MQEIRTDSLDPLMFVVEMKSHAYLPTVSRSFAISSKRLPEDPTRPLVFWLRLFSKSSIHMHFCSEVAVSVGPAETIWSELGRPVFVREGFSHATRQATQQLVFRLPLLLGGEQGETEEGETEEGEEGEGGDQFLTVPQANAITFLYVSDRSVDRYISLGTLPPDPSKALIPLPRTQGNLVTLQRDVANAPTLLGRTFPAALFDRKASTVPAFSWKLLILAEHALAPPLKPIPEEQVTQRFKGKFVANNHNALFRDIYSIEKASFPLAFRLTTSHNRPVSGSKAGQTAKGEEEKSAFQGLSSQNARKALRQALTVKGRKKDLGLVVNMYRAHDMKLVKSFKGGEGVLCYSQALDEFMPEGETFDLAGALEEKGKGGKDKGKDKGAKGGGGGGGGVDTVDVLIECLLDDETMMIGEEWLSRYPHVFDALFPDAPEPGVEPDPALAEGIASTAANIESQSACLGVRPPKSVLVKWQLDVLAGKVHNVSHDTRKLEQEYEHKVDYIPDPDILSFVRPRDLTDLDNEKRIAGELANRRTSERAASESRAANVAARFVTLNETLRAEAQARVSAITSEAVSDAVELGRLWEAREAYRVNVAARNQSVQFLLKRAAEARG
ncbi:hypothetical protein B484DRAFT_449029, partial [Ochromonadaceae sp. CCMP2298]